MRKYLLLALITCLTVFLFAENNIIFELDFELEDFTFSINDYTSISSSDLDFIHKENPGAPDLPFGMVKLLVPYDAEFNRLEISTKSQLLEKDILIRPSQPLVPTLPDYPQQEFVKPDPMIYNSNDSFPDQIVEYTGDHKISQYKIFTFLVSPFMYQPAERELYFIRNLSIEVFYNKTGKLGDARWDNGLFADILKPEVVNPIILENSIFRSPVDPNDIQYLIITSPSLVSYFQPLADWKTQTGVPAEVIDTDYIYANFTGANDQLKIKSCLEYYYSNKNTTWVLLGGDNTIIPDYDCYGNVNNGGTIDYYMPTDLFYACFDNQFDWNADGDGIKGETNDNIDMGPEIILSRAPIRTSSHVSAFVNKTLYYEQNPPTSNFAEDMLISGLQLWNTWSGRSDADWRCEKMWDDYIDPWWGGTHYRFYDTNTDFGGSGYNVTTANLTSQINSGYNNMFMATHGNQTLWSTETGSYYYSSHASQQTNQNLQGLIATMACITNAFDNSSGFGSDPCLSEAFIRNPNGGCVVYHGSSRYGWGYNNISDNHGPSLQYADYLYYYLFRGDPAENSYKFGAVAIETKIHFIGASSSYGAFRWLQFTLNTIGDPELDLLTYDPTPITINAPTSIMVFNTQPITIETNTPYASICLNNDLDVYITGECDASGNFTCTPNPGVDDDILITVTAHDKIYNSSILSVDALFPEIDVSVTEITETLETESTAQAYFSIENNGQPGSHLIYSLSIVSEEDTRSIIGSDISCSQTEYESGTENLTLNFTLYNASIDNEWISGASIDFPEDVIVNSSTDFFINSYRYLQTDYSTGDGVTVYWSDPDGGYGEIYPQEYVSATVNIDIQSYFYGDMALNWTMTGDIWGDEPHSISGSIILSQSGPTLHLTAPNGSEEWGIDEQHAINWEHTGELDYIDLKISRNSGTNWTNLANTIPNDGNFLWMVESPTSTDCLIKVCSPDELIADVSDAVFKIYQPILWLEANILSGDLEYGESDLIELTFDSSGMEPGIYSANVLIVHNAGDDLIIPVEMTVSSVTLPRPVIMETSLVNNGNSFMLSWNPVTGATNYNVYSSQDPYAQFPDDWLLEYSGPENSWISDINNNRKFFKITAEN